MSSSVRLNAEQEEIREVARGFLEARFPAETLRGAIAGPDGFERPVWNEMAELGWAAIALPEERGGAGYTVVERCLLLEEMGRVLCGVPYLSSAVLAADALALAADPEAADELLAKVAAGATLATLVAAGDLLGGVDVAGAVRASRIDGYVELSGSGGIAVGADSAELLLVAATDDDGGVGLFALEAAGAGVERSPLRLIDGTRRAAAVEFRRAPARRIDGGGDSAAALRRVLDRGAVSLAAECVGGARRALEMTVAYMHEREQFGGPIGRFQALKHRLADLHVAIDAARESVYAAADAFVDCGDDDPEPVSMAAAAAKCAAAECFERTTAEAIQLHGGIGFTEEHDIGLYYKRALVSEALLGAAAVHQSRIAAGLHV